MRLRLIRNVRLVRNTGIRPGSVLVRDGRITRIDPSEADAVGAEVFDGAGGLLTPGLIDMHTHGIGPHLYEASPESLVAGADLLARHGTTCVLPTFYTTLKRDTLGKLETLAAAVDAVQSCHIVGLHLEGPFLALTGAGASTLPGDVTLLDEILAACGGRARAMSISPETPNILPVIERLCAKGTIPFITHTRATPEQTLAAIDAGARHATHFYDVFPAPPETDPGVRAAGAVEAILADARVSVDFIADGCHVHPVAIRAAVAAKGPERVILITDSSVGAGLPPGTYPTPWGYPVTVREGDGARIADPAHPQFGGLAGSAITMADGIRNALQWLPLPAEQVWAMGTANPARLLGLETKGEIREGADADLVLWDEHLRPIRTWLAGECVFEA
ncbi:MAG: amidohydrolase family protein [Phycisphaerae bacterium]|nr:amidohydrolase family protein [Phycisphaerae bacterium]